MERLTTILSSRGLLKSCDHHNKSPVSTNNQIDINLLDGLKPGNSIYICTNALDNFVENFLNKINVEFVLVTGDSDMPISKDSEIVSSIRSLLDCPYLIKWFAQNLQLPHPKLEILPIGLDYHTMQNHPGFWGMSPVSSVAQEFYLLNVLSSSRAILDKYPLAYCNWHFAIDRGDRISCRELVDKNICHYQDAHLPRKFTWNFQAEFMFTLSPEGAGMDCHRTWESIILGSIPIIKENDLKSIFKNLPIILVDQWSDISYDILINRARDILKKEYDFNVMFREHWVAKFRGQNYSPLPLMKYEQFLEFLTDHKA